MCGSLHYQTHHARTVFFCTPDDSGGRSEGGRGADLLAAEFLRGRCIIPLGHEVLVANPRKLRLIAESDAKHDRADARLLARLAHVGPALLSPIPPRSAQTQFVAPARDGQGRPPLTTRGRQCRDRRSWP